MDFAYPYTFSTRWQQIQFKIHQLGQFECVPAVSYFLKKHSEISLPIKTAVYKQIAQLRKTLALIENQLINKKETVSNSGL